MRLLHRKINKYTHFGIDLNNNVIENYYFVRFGIIPCYFSQEGNYYTGFRILILYN